MVFINHSPEDFSDSESENEEDFLPFSGKSYRL